MVRLTVFFELVRTFWVVVYRAAKKGTETHLKAIKIFLLFCVVVFVILAGIFIKFTESSTFCGLCHQMNVYMESWRTSSHKHVACTKCHYEPGLVNHLKGKWVDGLVSLAYFLSG